jgi:hypothetical protein
LWRVGAHRVNSVCDFERAPYLRGLPTVSDYTAWLAGQERLTPRQQARLNAQFEPIREAVRDASERWQEHLDWDDWDEPTDAELLALEIEN